MYVAIPPDRDSEPVRVFKTFTADLECLVNWLIACGITTVAMESTGVYWIPLYQMLQDRGLRACLVNARHMKNVPGRRTDWHECQWLQYLHAAGLLRAAFRPEQDVCGVRTRRRARGCQLTILDKCDRLSKKADEAIHQRIVDSFPGRRMPEHLIPEHNFLAGRNRMLSGTQMPGPRCGTSGLMQMAPDGVSVT